LKKAKQCIALQKSLVFKENNYYYKKMKLNYLKKRSTIAEKAFKKLKEEILKNVERCKELEDNKRELMQNIELYKDQTRVLRINYQKLEAQNLELKEDMKRYEKQNGSIDNIKKDNTNLKTQLLMLSELYRGLKDRFTLINKNASFDEISVIESEARNKVKGFNLVFY
jgi:chromosome segregation ATPase